MATPQPQEHSRLSGSMTCSMRGRFSGRLPRLRLATRLRLGLSVSGVCWRFCSSVSETAMVRSSNASCRSSSLSFSDFLPCTTWFSSATRCSRRLLMSLRPAVSSLRLAASTVSSACSRRSATTASCWSSGMVERSIFAVTDMAQGYPEAPVNARPFDRPIHSAAAGLRASSALTLRHLRRENSPPDCFLILLTRQTAPRTAPGSASSGRP